MPNFLGIINPYLTAPKGALLFTLTTQLMVGFDSELKHPVLVRNLSETLQSVKG